MTRILIKKIRTCQAHERKNFAIKLAKTGSDKAVRELIRMSKGKRRKGIRFYNYQDQLSAIEALGETCNSKALRYLHNFFEEYLDQEQLKKTHEDEREFSKTHFLVSTAIHKLEICLKCVKIINNPKNIKIGETFFKALCEIGESAVEPLLRILYDEEKEGETLSKTLCKIGKSDAEPLLRIFYDEDEGKYIRNQVALALGEIGDKRAIEPLIRVLSDENEYVRRVAAEAIGKLGDKRAVEPLISALSDENEHVRREAARVLRRIGDKRAVEPLIKALSDEYNETRMEAAYALGEAGDKLAMYELLKALSDKDRDVRRKAAKALAEIGDKRAVKPLIELLENGSDSNEIGELLVKIGESTVEPLIEIFTDKDKYHIIRKKAAWALGEIRDKRAVEPLIRALLDEREYIGEIAIDALAKIGDKRVIKSIIKALLDGNISISIRYASIALRKIGDEAVAVEYLIKALSDEDVNIRLRAIKALYEIGDKRAVEPLISALSDEEKSVRWVAAEALSKIGDERAVEPLIKALSDKEKNVRNKAVIALGNIGDKRAVEPLIRVLSEKNIYYEDAIRALAKIGDKRALKPLIKALKAEDHDVSMRSAEALGKIGDERAVKPLEIYAKRSPIRMIDGHSEEFDVAFIYLGKIKRDKRTIEQIINRFLSGRAGYGSEAVSVLIEIGEPAVEPLIKTIMDTDENIQKHLGYMPCDHSHIIMLRNAARVLGEIRDKRAVEPLVMVLNSHTACMEGEAAEALVKIGEEKRAVEILIKLLIKEGLLHNNIAKSLVKIGKSAVEPLIKIFSDENKYEYTRKKAARALGEIRDKRAIDPLIKALSDKNEDIRLVAIEVLCKIGDKRIVEPLISALCDRDKIEVCKAIVKALGEIGDSKAVEPLIKVLDENNYYLSYMATIALGKIGDKRAVEPLIRVLGWTYEYIRFEAAEALGKIGDKRAIGPLIKALDDNNYHLRYRASKALERIG